jgi:FkbM family methyltransferase
MKIVDRLRLIITSTGFAKRRFSLDKAVDTLVWILDNYERIEKVFELLDDEPSRELFVALLRYRVLGPSHVRLPTNEPGYWTQYRSINRRYLIKARAVNIPGTRPLNLYVIPGLCGDIRLLGWPGNVLNTFLLEQYAYKREDCVVRVKPGDIVIDGGGCWGDTALYFADRVGPEGQVYCFEFCQNNLDILEQNLAMNPHLALRIHVIPKALWHSSGEEIRYHPSGPGTSLVRAGKFPTMSVVTISLDRFAEEAGLPKIDFVKLDVEGSELQVLRGAQAVLRTYKPSLAISVYHKGEDLVDIPLYLKELDIGYQFFLDHFTIHSWETVLFARSHIEGVTTPEED